MTINSHQYIGDMSKYSGPDDKNLPDNVKKMPTNMRKRWLQIHDKTYAGLTKNGMASDKAASAAARVADKNTSGKADEHPSNGYMSKLLDFVKAATANGRVMSDDDMSEFHKLARSSAGGSAAAQKRRNLADAVASEASGEDHIHVGEEQLFVSFTYAEPPSRINVLPKPGKYAHPVYGEIVVSKERNKRFVDNFNKGIYQAKVPIDIEHETKLSGAAGWIVELTQRDDGSVDAYVEWTDRGNEAIKTDRFKYFSPEWYNQWQDPLSKTVYKDVLIGGAICTRPFFKEPGLRPLVASESGIQIADIFDEDDSVFIFDEMVFGEIEKAPTTIAAYLEAVIHSNFTRAADDLRKFSYLTQAERIQLSNAIGEALKTWGVTADQNVLERIIEIPAGYFYNEGDLPRDLPALIFNNKEDEMTITQEQLDVMKASWEASNAELKTKIDELGGQVATLITEKDAAKTAAETATNQLQSANEQIGVLLEESRVRKFTDMVEGRGGANDGIRWYGPVEEHVSMLQSLATAFGEDSNQFKAYVEMQSGNAKRLKESGLFNEVGASHLASETSGDKIKDAVKALRTEKPALSEAEAYSEVIQAHPEWYKETRHNMDARIRAGGDDK